ncbi:flagellar export protein FliJ [Halomonas heilongjiangensis]|uniref:flagellar export protein FliJ n=1 Tax=Halomonas heilongjiangensis TaxID=1387883 RepID=UPI000D75B09D|nr:flagellar export protein FliJ [Halomonas heilongjiangensis]PXX92905.1 flagellar export protein FliJ [Halomonas heilongjiangensis]
MRSASTPLETLADLARDARDQAGQALAGERASERQVVGQLESLGRYRLEYAQRLQQAMHEGIDPATMRNYQQFLDSLDDALARARQALAAQQQRVGQRQAQWQQEQRKLSSYDTLVSRRAMQQSLQEQRRELRTSDDLVNGRLVRERYASSES